MQKTNTFFVIINPFSNTFLNFQGIVDAFIKETESS